MARAALVAPSVLAAMLVPTSECRATPQWNVGVVAGVCGEGDRDAVWDSTCLYSALRGDVLFGRTGDRDAAAGPYVEVASADLADMRLAGGGELLLPITEYIPVVLSAGAYARKNELGWEPGLTTRLFFGARSYNFHSTYGIAGGLLTGFDYGLGDSKEVLIVIGLQIDGLLITLPFVAGYEWLRGPPDEEE